MTTFASLGGAHDQEGVYKFLLGFRPGYAYGLAVSQHAGTPNGTVDVAVGGGMMVTSSNIPYFGWTDAVVNVAGVASDPTNPRKDIVVQYLDLSMLTLLNTNNQGATKYKVVAGTAAGSPVDPSDSTIQSSVGAGNPWIKLARIDVPAAGGNIVDAWITDIRAPMGSALPYIYGGSNNIKGHSVPNVSDDTVALLNATQSGANKTWSSSALNTSTLDGTNWLTQATAGWIVGSGTWTYVTATTLTVPAADAARMTRGTKIWLTQTTSKYFYVIGVSGTTITIAANSDYTFANAAVTAPFFSNYSTPFGFPDNFNYTPASSTGWTAPTYSIARYSLKGRICILVIAITGTSVSTTSTVKLPITAANVNGSGLNYEGWCGLQKDNGAVVTNSGAVVLDPVTDATNAYFYTGTRGGWTGSGTKEVRATLTYEIA